MDFIIYLHNLGDIESEKPEISVCTSWRLQIFIAKVGSILGIFDFSGLQWLKNGKPTCAHRCFPFFAKYFHDISIFRMKTYVPM